ncbi:hypothetical protein H6F50_00220 [Coleofasciculus sp. FACHB-712]|uniref:hypothetical protein n=1 Tax=Coleofasciculus sp. FACHB-712 TaxID=2692789 RepID=UPI00168908E6|nr:hypothetical protein [Coleofasciculus sp. FACHB-712]MBD1940782.1 hypothetical protein [Coleofasciculus sp. FACHB-712]
MKTAKRGVSLAPKKSVRVVDALYSSLPFYASDWEEAIASPAALSGFGSLGLAQVFADRIAKNGGESSRLVRTNRPSGEEHLISSNRKFRSDRLTLISSNL